MKLQLALDGTLSDSLALLRVVRADVEIVEIGTPLIFREGMNAVRQIRLVVPEAALLADLKIMDAGEAEATIAFEAGCDIVTVLGVTHDATIQGAITAARRFGGKIMADMMQVPQPTLRAETLLKMGCDYLCIHTAHDLKVSPLAALQQLRQDLPGAPLAVAGGIKLETLAAIAALKPEIVIIGSAITRASDPLQSVHAIRDAYEQLS